MLVSSNKHVTITLPPKDFEVLEKLARECSVSMEFLCSEIVQCRVAKERMNP